MLSAKSLQILGEMLSLVTLDLTFFPAHIEAKEKEVLFCVLNAEETVGEGGGGGGCCLSTHEAFLLCLSCWSCCVVHGLFDTC